MNCKRNLSILIALLALSLLLCGCRGSDPGGLNGASEAPSSIGTTEGDTWENLHYDPVTEPTEPEDPYPPEAYEYSFGTPLEVDYSDEDWAVKLSDIDGVCQIVYQYDRENDEVYDWNDSGTFIPLRVLHYSSFPQITIPVTKMEAKRDEATAHSVSVNVSDLNYWGPKFVQVNDPMANAALVDQIANLEFTAVSNTYNARDWTAVFAISGPTVSGEYAICRDGSVYRNGRAVSVTPLSEEATDYFFAVANAWVMCATETYPVFSGAVYEDSKCIRASSEGKEIFLIGKDAESLAELLTDEENFSFACEPRFNCAPEDHGQALCEFASGSYDSENGFTQSGSMYVFTLWSDGHVTALMPPALTCGTLDHDQVCDQLSVSCLYVSETAFDIEAVEAFLAEHGG